MSQLQALAAYATAEAYLLAGDLGPNDPLARPDHWLVGWTGSHPLRRWYAMGRVCRIGWVEQGVSIQTGRLTPLGAAVLASHVGEPPHALAALAALGRGHLPPGAGRFVTGDMEGTAQHGPP